MSDHDIICDICGERFKSSFGLLNCSTPCGDVYDDCRFCPGCGMPPLFPGIEPGVAEAVKQLRKLGIKTCHSCEGIDIVNVLRGINPIVAVQVPREHPLTVGFLSQTIKADVIIILSIFPNATIWQDEKSPKGDHKHYEVVVGDWHRAEGCYSHGGELEGWTLIV